MARDLARKYGLGLANAYVHVQQFNVNFMSYQFAFRIPVVSVDKSAKAGWFIIKLQFEGLIDILVGEDDAERIIEVRPDGWREEVIENVGGSLVEKYALESRSVAPLLIDEIASRMQGTDEDVVGSVIKAIVVEILGGTYSQTLELKAGYEMEYPSGYLSWLGAIDYGLRGFSGTRPFSPHVEWYAPVKLTGEWEEYEIETTLWGVPVKARLVGEVVATVGVSLDEIFYRHVVLRVALGYAGSSIAGTMVGRGTVLQWVTKPIATVMAELGISRSVISIARVGTLTLVFVAVIVGVEVFIVESARVEGRRRSNLLTFSYGYVRRILSPNDPREWTRRPLAISGSRAVSMWEAGVFSANVDSVRTGAPVIRRMLQNLVNGSRPTEDQLVTTLWTHLYHDRALLPDQLFHQGIVNRLNIPHRKLGAVSSE